MPLYALKPGQKHFKRNNDGGSKARLTAINPGEIIELTDSQYNAFSEKFEYVGRTEGEEAIETAETDGSEPTAPVLVRREDGGYDLVNPDTEAVLNDNPLAIGDVAEAIDAYNATVSDETAEAIAQDTVAAAEDVSDDGDEDEDSDDEEKKEDDEDEERDPSEEEVADNL